ncbi:MAG: hypothetical protein C0168_03250 [Candidatus Aminicenantes bacterium]|nr:MAG: hypothetical protein C0168_03250 [Candidatus Aminicenantes bacterium]
MKRNRAIRANGVFTSVAFLILFITLVTPCLQAQNINLGLSLTDGKIRNFYFSISSYFNVPEPRVVEIRERYRLADDELPVVFFLATQARVEPAAIIELRLRGLSWWDITLHFGLNPEIFFVPVNVVKIGPPYGKAFGFYRQYRERKTWGPVVLADADIINLVNLKFISEYQKISPERVIEMRAKGHHFVDINETIVQEKRKAKGPEEGPKAKPKKGKGHKK